MPSHRRIVSSPASPRSSPYNANSSSSSSSSRQAASRIRSGHPHRRAFGSDTSTRRVLADLDWWTVHDGQCDPIRVIDENRTTRDENSPPTLDSFPAISFAYESLAYSPMEWPNMPETPIFPVASVGPVSFEFETPSRSDVRSPSPSSSSSSTPTSSGPSTPTSTRFALPNEPWESNMSNLSPLPTTKRMPSRLAKPAVVRAHTFSDFTSLMQEDYLTNYSSDNVSSAGLAAPFGGYADFSTSSPLSSGFHGLFN